MSDDKHEIVIIRRGGHGDHDEHHGGVWKIAFADFMTAMMAFFLVMWLISANDKTRATIARYFNPVQLVDPTLQPRGLQDAKKDSPSIAVPADTRGDKNTSGGGKTSDPEKKAGETPQAREKRLDTAMRDNPLATLAEIAAGTESAAKDTPHPSTPVIGRKGGTAFRDPFAPPPAPTRQMSQDDEEPIIAAAAPKPPKPAVPGAKDAMPPASTAAQDINKPTDANEKLDELGRQIAGGGDGKDIAGPQVKLTRTSEGLLVSITDTENFSMFTNGSAVPNKRLIATMERVAKLLGAHKGEVVVRGFTDNKPFHSGHYDNWNLSIDRAQAAHYMLIRGGLAAARIAAVQGFADRVARPGIDPASPLNRRIEVLVKETAK